MLAHDLPQLSLFLSKISEASKRNFSPHQLDLTSISSFHHANQNLIPHIAIDNSNKNIIAYSLLMSGCVKHDIDRLNAYNIEINRLDLSWAPCILDEYHGSGISKHIFSIIKQEMKAMDYQRIFLWGGVRSSNIRAIKYYQKLGFIELGSFQHRGLNKDMVYHF